MTTFLGKEAEPQPRPVDDTDAWRGYEPTE